VQLKQEECEMGKGTRRLVLAAVLAATMMLLAATAATGAPNKDCSDPTWADRPVCQRVTTTTTIEAPAAAPSCYERVREMGATAWAYDPVDPGDATYPTETQWDGVCVDIDQPGHTGAVTWEVTWGGGATARPIKGIMLVFELGVHGTVYAEHMTTEATGDWTVSIDTEGLEPLVLVAMPRAGDRWTASPTFTVTPAAGS
jgi:hypothetical protein